jgi:hypothetical protein
MMAWDFSLNMGHAEWQVTIFGKAQTAIVSNSPVEAPVSGRAGSEIAHEH